MIESDAAESDNYCPQKEPHENLSNDDPGDDTLRRFRFQISFATILSVIMIDSTNYNEVYCEHHEDILLRHPDGKFTGIQVKTKDINLPPFTIDDEAIFNSFKKFVNLDKKFPDKFKVFSIVSNHGFDKSKPAICIDSLLSNIKDGVDILASRTKFKKFIVKLSEECVCSTRLVLETLKKIRLRTYCNLDDINMKLVNQLKKCSLLTGTTESKLHEIADSLITKHFKASSLYRNDDNVVLGFVSGEVDVDADVFERIAQKKITCEELKKWLEHEKVLPVKLRLKDRQKFDDAIGVHQKLQIKMDAGGIDSENIDTIRDFKFAFEQHTASWLYKNNEEDAEARYHQVLAITNNVCKEVYDEFDVQSDNNMGQKMLIEVRKEIKDRRNREPEIFFDCTYEHVLGAIGVLTEACKVWWSPKFKIDGD